MSHTYDETAADVPVRDSTLTLSRQAASSHADTTLSSYNARTRNESTDVSRVPREELEDRFLRLHDENRHLKQHIHKQEDKIKKLGTKLMRLVKDRGRMEQLAAGGAGQLASRVRDIEMEEMIEELQDKVRTLQMENEQLKQRLLVSKQQLLTAPRRTPYSHVQPRVNTGLKKLSDATTVHSRPKGSSGQDIGGRPRFGHSLLEEARAEIRNLENVIEMQRSHTEEAERQVELLQEELRTKESEHEQEILKLRQQQTSKLRSHVSDNMMMIKLQKQLTERSSAVTELEGRFLQLQEGQRSLKVSHDAAMAKVDELSDGLKEERMKSLNLEKQLQASSVAAVRMQQLQERLSEVEQERDVLKENNEKLINSALDVSQQQNWRLREQELKLQVAQLETALQADLVDKNQILDKIQAERDANEKTKEENQKLHIQFLEQQQQLEELRGQLKCSSTENGYDAEELAEALLLVKTRKAQKEVEFLGEVGEGSCTLQELRAAHAETIQELQKTRSILNTESNISKHFQAELEAVLKKTEGDRAEHQRKLERQARLLDTRAAKIHKLEAQLKEIAYGTKPCVLRTGDNSDEGDEAIEMSEEALHLERGENLLQLRISSAALSPVALELLGDGEPSTFCTYAFYTFELHSTPVVAGRQPRYGFTSKYVVTVDNDLLEYLHRGSLAVELHQAMGLEWKTVARAQIRLQQLLEQDGKIHGSAPLVGDRNELCSFGTLEYWLRLSVPMSETLSLFREKTATTTTAVAADNDTHALSRPDPGGDDSSTNQLFVTVQSCGDLPRSPAHLPSPFVVYKFSHFPDCPTVTVAECSQPHFDHVRCFTVAPGNSELDRYLRSERLHFYVFDFKEQRMDEYLGKASVELLPLALGQEVSGVFDLADPYGRPAGHIQISLRWKFPYVPLVSNGEAEHSPAEKTEKTELAERKPLTQKSGDVEKAPGIVYAPLETNRAQPPLPALRQRTLLKETKKVKFVDSDQDNDTHESAAALESKKIVSSAVVQKDSSPAVLSTEGDIYDDDDDETDDDDDDEDDDDDKDEEMPSQFSEGQLVPASPLSDNSEISEDIEEDIQEGAPVVKDDTSASSQADSDDCVILGTATARKNWERIRVEVQSLSLRPEGRLARDSGVVRLFVEFSLLDLPTEETPMSLPKPRPGRSINFNYSKVVPLDGEEHGARRQLLREALQGRNPQMENIRFTVVSEPPEEEEQEKECDDVGVASLRIADMLEQKRDLLETQLDILDLQDSATILGQLTVTVEALEALQAVMEIQDSGALAQLPLS